LLFDLAFGRFQPGHFVHGHLLQIQIRFAQHAARFCQIAVHLFPFAILRHHLGKLAVGLGHLAILVGILDHGRIRHLAIEVFEAHLDLIEFLQKLHGSV
jgi:hypothetical protein